MKLQFPDYDSVFLLTCTCPFIFRQESTFCLFPKKNKQTKNIFGHVIYIMHVPMHTVVTRLFCSITMASRSTVGSVYGKASVFPIFGFCRTSEYNNLSSLSVIANISKFPPLISLPSSSSLSVCHPPPTRPPARLLLQTQLRGRRYPAENPTQVGMWPMETTSSPSTHQPLAFSSPPHLFAFSATSLQHSSSLILLHLELPNFCWTRLWFPVSTAAPSLWFLQPETDLFSKDSLGLEWSTHYGFTFFLWQSLIFEIFPNSWYLPGSF